MIDRDAKPIKNDPPYKPVDIRYPGRPRVITREQIEDGIYRQPDPAIYASCNGGNVWILKD